MKVRRILALFVLFIALAGPAHAALTSTITHGYGSSSTHVPTSAGIGSTGADYLAIVKPDPVGFSDAFYLAGLASISQASIRVTHNGNFNTVQPDGFGEKWQVKVNGMTLTNGSLSNSFYDWATGMLISGWRTDTFTLDSAVVASINNSHSPLAAVVSFIDLTLGQNNFTLNSVSITATGNATPVPLPGAIAFLAPALLGMGLVRRIASVD